MAVPEFTLHALAGVARGHLQIADWKKWAMAGTIQDISIHEAAALRTLGARGMDGKLSGPIQASGYFRKGGVDGIRAEGKVNLQPAAGSIPLEGDVQFQNNKS